MLELIFQGLIEWLYGLILEAWEYFFSVFTDILDVDFEYLKVHMPVIPEIMKILLAVGWALLIGNLVFQAAKSMMTGLGFEGEDPKQLFARTFVFAFLLVASPQICEIGLSMTAEIINLLDAVDSVDVELLGAGAFAGLTAEWLIIIVINVILMFKVFRLLLEIVERYLVLAFLTMCAPMAFGMGGSKNTSDIFSGWVRMFASMCFVMMSNMLFFKLLLSLLGNVPTGLDVLVWIALVFGVVKVARKVDSIITRVGLNPALTGDGLGGHSLPGMLAYTVVRSMASNVIKAAGNSAGSTAGGSSGSGSGAKANGGKPNFNSPAGAGSSKSASGKSGAGKGSNSSAQQNTNTHTSSSQTGAVQNGGQKWSPVGQPVNIQPDDNEAAAMEGASPMPNINTQAQSSDASGKTPDRKSSVPPGAARSPSYMKPGGGANTNSAKGSTTNSSRNTSAASVTQTGTGESGTHKPGTAGSVTGSNVRMASDNGRTPQSGTAGTGDTSGTRRTSVEGKTPRPGMAGTAASSKVRAGTVNGKTMQSGTAGTVAASSEHTVHGGVQSSSNGTAGTASPASMRFTNATISTQNQTAHNSGKSEQQSAVTLDGAKQAPSGGVGKTPPASMPGTGASHGSAESRFSQRPAAAQPLHSGTGPQPGTAGTAPTAQSSNSGQPAKESQRIGGVGNGSPAPASAQLSGTARQEPRISHQSGTASGGSKPSRASAQQEPRKARPSSVNDGGKRGASAPAPAWQERRAASREPSAIKGMASIQHPGTAGTAPPAARPSRAGKDDTRAPRPENTTPADAKEDTAPAEVKPKEEAGNE